MENVEDFGLTKAGDPRKRLARKNEGRPVLFKTTEELEEAVNSYFNSCFSVAIDKKTNQIIRDDEGKQIIMQTKPFTVSGLAFALNMTRETLLDYQKNKNDEFSDIIMRAKQMCEIYAEERLYDKDGANGAKFVLSNNYARWSAKSEITLKSIDEIIEDD